METKKELTAADLRVGQKVFIECDGDKFVSEINAINIDPRAPFLCMGNYGRALNFRISEIKPILRRLGSMNESESVTYNKLCAQYDWADSSDGPVENPSFDTYESVLWLIDNGFDVRGWIDAGLAVDAATLERSGE